MNPGQNKHEVNDEIIRYVRSPRTEHSTDLNDIEEGDFGRDRLGRDDVDLARETSFKFQ